MWIMKNLVNYMFFGLTYIALCVFWMFLSVFFGSWQYYVFPSLFSVLTVWLFRNKKISFLGCGVALFFVVFIVPALAQSASFIIKDGLSFCFSDVLKSGYLLNVDLWFPWLFGILTYRVTRKSTGSGLELQHRQR